MVKPLMLLSVFNVLGKEMMKMGRHTQMVEGAESSEVFQVISKDIFY